MKPDESASRSGSGQTEVEKIFAFGEDAVEFTGDASTLYDMALKLADEVDKLRAAAVSERQRSEAPVCTEHATRGLTPEMVMAHYGSMQHQPDECELCDAVVKIAAEALSHER